MRTAAAAPRPEPVPAPGGALRDAKLAAMPSPARKASAAAAAAAEPKAPTALDVVNHLKERLRRGEIVPGQRLVEPDVMRETGASRARVREALLRLSTDGMVELHEFRGAVVKRLTRDEVKQAYDMREMLEGLAARLTAGSGLDRAARAALAALQREMDAAVAATSIERFVRANDGYHRFIVAHAGNAYLDTFLERLRLPVFRLQFHIFYEADAMRRSNTDHQAITAAILAGDGRKAEAAMRSHVRSGYATVSQLEDRYFA